MTTEQAIRDTIITVLQNKVKEFGYNPLPEKVSTDRMLFRSEQGKSIEVILRLLNLEKDSSTSINQREFDYTPRPDLWILLVLTMNDMKPVPYLIPSTVFNTPNNIFLNNTQSPALRHFSTWQIKVFTKAIPELSRYALDAVSEL
ncbi:MAG: hypothetical protein QM640_02270 [Niabella sp.]